jgi:hypothetical protein
MNRARTFERSNVIHAHPAIDRLEDEIQSNVTVTRRFTTLGPIFTIHAGCTASVGQGTTIHGAVEAFKRNLFARI